ncbi:helix-turn-helix domain-containing protein [Flavobacterium paronense]|uniref:Helix-turn-helix domain-containing protein n=1 Tax=Flavobacterium paronense TaxID=1392775 RepID=A0ABV5GBQ4_9FLAO|nr:helix-turn-helix domain-containing protein [Flavobacterium paronense]MDN3677607.1 helix-turn-helix domain-containing protein [Flavobacterium paronense]
MKIKIYKPKSDILQNHIECFYSLQRNNNDEDITYFGFPSNTVYVTLCQNAKISIDENDVTIENHPNEEIKSILIIDNQKQGSTTYKGSTNEITIYFKPLGINFFLEESLSNFIINTISEFNPFEDYTSTINEVFKIKEDAAKIEFLENYLVSKYNDFKHSFLHEAIEKIANENTSKISIAALSERFEISRTTLHKQFLLHIGTNPSQFIKIERFRSAIKMFTKNASKEQLIDIAYLADYFDQSHMAKDFKSLTGYSPKVFFSKLSLIENNQINWIFS